MRHKVAIVGRPNVGKSTLFNRLTGLRQAIVHDRPGVTRDRRYGAAHIADFAFEAIDTAGFEDTPESELEQAMQAQTARAIEEAAAVLLLIDARAGITPVDREFAEQVRRAQKPVILVANKCEGRAGQAGLLEAFALGLGEAVPISAEHGEGMGDLYDALVEALGHPEPDTAGTDEADDFGPGLATAEAETGIDLDEEEEPKALQIVIVGRPNVGKSTLLNRLLNEERVITGPMPGLTRDAIAVDWQYRGRPIRLIDTAGMRKRARVQDSLERLSVGDTQRAIRFAHVVVLMIDANEGLERQDLAIARHVEDEGRALVLAVNKWDAVADREATMQRIRDRLETSLAQLRGVPIVTFSALTGHRVDRLMQAVTQIYDTWNVRVPTGRLNRWFAALQEAHPPPLVAGRRLKLRYITQIKRRPPTFAVFAARAGQLPTAYVRYLINGLRQDFGLQGVPIRVVLRQPDNPYADDD
ncbi:MAG: ribosome biogenesis GTPase Der [Alphaproteobacteria bacterium]|nr:ribosome biogenesis GTPase Der [Alphaproteobacteria bacterium]